MGMKQINESIDAEKIEKGCRHIFSYMDKALRLPKCAA